MDDITFDDNKNSKDRNPLKRVNIDKKYYYFAIMGLFLIVGISYAFIFFREKFEGNNLGLITELLDVTITENGMVKMDNAIPQKDEEGIENDKTTFNIVNNNKVPIRVVIKLVEDANSNMDINQVRFGIFASGKLMNIGNLGESDGVLLDFQMDPGQDATLESTIWLDYYYEGGTTSEVFSGKYVVEASNIDDYGYMYLKNLVGKNKGLVAINTDGELASEGDEIREYRYSGSAKYCTYTVDGNTYQLNVDIDTCPSACYMVTTIFRNDNVMVGNSGGCSVIGGAEILPNQTMPLDGEVDNYVWFNNEMWRIIGIFKETTGEGKNQELIKIVRAEPLLKEEVPSTYTYNGKEMVIENITNIGNSKYANVYWNYENYFNQTNPNDWTKSALQYYLNDETSGANSYYNSIEKNYQKMIETIDYNISNAVYDTNAILSYNEERSGNVYSGNQVKWRGKIGMIYPSDYGYAADSSNWNVSMRYYGEVSNTGGFNNWMNDNISKAELTLSPSSYSFGYTMFKYAMGNVYTQFTNGEEQAVSPVLYLKSDVMITAGNGSEEKPYQVERPELVRIPTKATTTIKSKLGTDGLVAINTNGELADDNDTIREYRYSGSAKYCTYTVDGNTYQLNVDTDVCPDACYRSNTLFRNDNTLLEMNGGCLGMGGTETSPNQTIPLDGEVDNYVWFNNEMWRIIGVFNENTGSGKNQELIKIVRDEPLLQEEVPSTYTYNNVEMAMKNIEEPFGTAKHAYMYWNYENYFGQKNYNDWTQASLQYYLNDETSGTNSYYNSIGMDYQKMIETVQFNMGNTNCNVNTMTSYNNERSNVVWEGNKATWNGKIGLIYPSDYGYAADNSNWLIDVENYGLTTNTGGFNNWMRDNLRAYEWAISPTSEYANHVMDVSSSGYVGIYNVNYNFVVSPVLYLKSDVLITGGNGSEEEPYIVERYEVKKKPTKVVDEIKSKVGTDGLVAINTNGTLVDEDDKIREYRYSGSARYCTYTVDGNTYRLEVDGDTCPSAWHLSNNGTNYIVRSDNDVFNVDTGIWSSMVRTEIVSNENKPLDGEVDNYVLFNNEMWRIIGVFNETSDGTVKELVKIVRDEPLLQEEVSEIYTYNGKPMELKYPNAPYATLKHAYMYWNRENYFGQTNQNDWTNASLQYYLNDETSGVGSYYNSIQSDYRIMIEPIEYHISNTAYNPTAITSYNNERSGNVWEGNKATWNGKIGLIYPSDYGYAADSSNWSIGMNSFGLISNTGAFNNWMNNNVDLSAWTMSPSSNGNYFALAIFSYGYLDNSHVYYTPTVSPVLYLKNGVLVTDGDGSYDNPYKLG